MMLGACAAPHVDNAPDPGQAMLCAAELTKLAPVYSVPPVLYLESQEAVADMGASLGHYRAVGMFSVVFGYPFVSVYKYLGQQDKWGVLVHEMVHYLEWKHGVPPGEANATRAQRKARTCEQYAAASRPASR